MLVRDYIDEMTRKGRAAWIYGKWEGNGERKEEIKRRSQDEGSNVRALNKEIEEV